MKKAIIILLLLSFKSFAQPSWEGRLYHSISPNDRTTVKINTSFHHDYTGTSHMGLVFENFTLGSHTAFSWAVEAGYAFDNIGKKKRLEIMPMANIGLMYYSDVDPSFRLQLGLDISYRFNGNFAIHGSLVGGKENHHENTSLDIRQYVYVASLGVSYRPHFYRK